MNDTAIIVKLKCPLAWRFSSSAAGIPEDKLVESHGTFATATCQKCRTKYDGDDIKVLVMFCVILMFHV